MTVAAHVLTRTLIYPSYIYYEYFVCQWITMLSFHCLLYNTNLIFRFCALSLFKLVFVLNTLRTISVCTTRHQLYIWQLLWVWPILSIRIRWICWQILLPTNWSYPMWTRSVVWISVNCTCIYCHYHMWLSEEGLRNFLHFFECEQNLFSTFNDDSIWWKFSFQCISSGIFEGKRLFIWVNPWEEM